MIDIVSNKQTIAGKYIQIPRAATDCPSIKSIKTPAKPKNTITKIDTAAYQKAKDEIGNRVDVVRSGVAQIGVQSVQRGHVQRHLRRPGET